MRFDPALHPDGSHAATPELIVYSAETTWNKTMESVMLTQSSKAGPAMTAIDFSAIERQARAARSAWIANEIKVLSVLLGRSFERVMTGLSNEVKVLLARPIKH